MGDLPQYFEEYMEQKFANLSQQITEFHRERTEEIRKVKEELIAIEGKANSANTIANKANSQILKWSGGVAVLVAIGLVTGGVLAAHFKILNGIQVTASVTDAVKPFKEDVNNLQKDVKGLQNDVASLKSHVFNYEFIEQ